MAKSKKQGGRFDGLTEEQVKQKDCLPDYLEPDLDIIFLGINPSLMAAHKGRYYAGPGNHFYKLLYAAELVPKFVGFEDDGQLLQYKIGLTNIVDRASRSSADLTKTEIRQGCKVVTQKIINYKPKIVVFNGKCIYQVFAEQRGKNKFNFGLQHETIGNTIIWVVPSSSARCSNFPRMDDKLPFYLAIKKHLLYLKGELKNVNINEFYFTNKVKETISATKRTITNINDKNISQQDEYPEFVVMEILDGTQKNYKEELNNAKVELINDKMIEKSSTELKNNLDILQIPEPKKFKKLNFSNIKKENRGNF